MTDNSRCFKKIIIMPRTVEYEKNIFWRDFRISICLRCRILNIRITMFARNTEANTHTNLRE